jgi:hypothetical protein
MNQSTDAWPRTSRTYRSPEQRSSPSSARILHHALLSRHLACENFHCGSTSWFIFPVHEKRSCHEHRIWNRELKLSSKTSQLFTAPHKNNLFYISKHLSFMFSNTSWGCDAVLLSSNDAWTCRWMAAFRRNVLSLSSKINIEIFTAVRISHIIKLKCCSDRANKVLQKQCCVVDILLL